MSRTSDMLAVLGRYPELATKEAPSAQLVEFCCARIPKFGIAGGLSAAKVLEAACERALVARANGNLAREKIGNYILLTFGGMAANGVPATNDFTRVEMEAELAEMERACREQDAERARRAAAPVVQTRAALFAHALSNMRPRPSIDDFPSDVCVVRPRVRANPHRDFETEYTAPIADALPTETMRENAAHAHDQERRTREVVEEHARRRAGDDR
jgi:hypothetical protein